MRTYDDLWDAVYSECKRLPRHELDIVAERAGVPSETLRKYLGGRPGIGYARVERLADVLGIEVAASVTRRQQSDDLVGSGVAA